MKQSHQKKARFSAIAASFHTRTFRVGGYSVAATLIVIALAVTANLFVGALPSGMTQFDTTASQLYSLSSQTKSILADLEDDVTIYWIVQSGQEDTTLETLLDRYAALSDHIKIEQVDPDVSPTFMEQYSIDTLYNNSLVVESNLRHTYVGYDTIYQYDYGDDYSSYNVSFAGESALTSAVDYVVSDTLPKLYLLSGHGEQTLSSDMQSAVEQQNIEVESLSLLTQESVPEDADCILIYDPQSDLSETEKEQLLQYLESGGNLFLITAPSHTSDAYPNLSALMEHYGVSAEDGIVVEGDASNYMFSSALYLLPNLESHDITSPLIEENYHVLLPVAHGIRIDSNLRDSLSVTSLLTTSDSAYSKQSGYDMQTYDKEEGDTDGPFSLAVAISETLEDDTASNLVWVSSAYLLDSQTDAQVSGGNQDFFLNCINWMCQQEGGISIHAKSMNYEYLTISSATAMSFTLLIVAVLPIACPAAGIWIWIRRKRK